MTELIEWNIEDKERARTCALGACDPGQTIRFSHISYRDAMNEKAFYIVSSKKDERVTIFCPMNGEVLIRDASHQVIYHDATFQAKPTRGT